MSGFLKSIRYLLIGLLMICTGLNIYYYLKVHSYNILVSDLSSSNESINLILSNIINNKEIELNSDKYLFSPNIKIKDDHYFSHPISQIITDKTIVFRFTKFHCDACITFHLNMLNDLKSELSNSKIIILSDYNMREMRVVMNSLNLDIPLYSIDTLLDLPIEKCSTPYFFLIDENLRCSNFQIAIKESPQLMKSYLLSLSKIHSGNMGI